ncbi:hypothetical protein Syun_007881 [Stephania yunnanensis]|uniref:Cell cycle checkpoint control protein RAD9A n=1 Tax=Stephania yunnanensis TaxID=152371 RepID=A0AAP0L0C6_9MAGN
MELSLSGDALKTFRRSITCLARVGHEVAIQASPSQIVLHTLNSSRSAYQSATFKLDFFDGYAVTADSVQFSVLLKAVCAVLRTPVTSVDLLSMVLPGADASKVEWILQCGDGMKKSYWTNCNVEPEIQHLTLDRQRFQSSFTIRPQDFRRLLSIFCSSIQEITVIANELNSAHSDAAKSIGGKAVGLRSFVDPAKENNESDLHTQLWIDPMEEFLEYKHSAGPVDVTFAVKELKAFLSFCEGCEVDIHLFFEKAGEPILLAPRFSLDDWSISNFDATLVLATMLVSQINEGNLSEQQPAATPTRCGEADRRGGSQGNQEKSRAGVSEQPPDQARIWSELPGNATKSASVVEDVPMQVQRRESVNGESGLQTKNAIDASKKVRNVSDTPDLNQHTMAADDVEVTRDKAEATSQCCWSQRHPSNWVDADEDPDEEDESDLCVESTP